MIISAGVAPAASHRTLSTQLPMSKKYRPPPPQPTVVATKSAIATDSNYNSFSSRSSISISNNSRTRTRVFVGHSNKKFVNLSSNTNKAKAAASRKPSTDNSDNSAKSLPCIVPGRNHNLLSMALKHNYAWASSKHTTSMETRVEPTYFNVSFDRKIPIKMYWDERQNTDFRHWIQHRRNIEHSTKKAVDDTLPPVHFAKMKKDASTKQVKMKKVNKYLMTENQRLKERLKKISGEYNVKKWEADYQSHVVISNHMSRVPRPPSINNQAVFQKIFRPPTQPHMLVSQSTRASDEAMNTMRGKRDIISMPPVKQKSLPSHKINTRRSYLVPHPPPQPIRSSTGAVTLSKKMTGAPPVKPKPAFIYASSTFTSQNRDSTMVDPREEMAEADGLLVDGFDDKSDSSKPTSPALPREQRQRPPSPVNEVYNFMKPFSSTNNSNNSSINGKPLRSSMADSSHGADKLSKKIHFPEAQVGQATPSPNEIDNDESDDVPLPKQVYRRTPIPDKTDTVTKEDFQDTTPEQRPSENGEEQRSAEDETTPTGNVKNENEETEMIPTAENETFAVNDRVAELRKPAVSHPSSAATDHVHTTEAVQDAMKDLIGTIDSSLPATDAGGDNASKQQDLSPEDESSAPAEFSTYTTSGFLATTTEDDVAKKESEKEHSTGREPTKQSLVPEHEKEEPAKGDDKTTANLKENSTGVENEQVGKRPSSSLKDESKQNDDDRLASSAVSRANEEESTQPPVEDENQVKAESENVAEREKTEALKYDEREKTEIGAVATDVDRTEPALNADLVEVTAGESKNETWEPEKREVEVGNSENADEKVAELEREQTTTTHEGETLKTKSDEAPELKQIKTNAADDDGSPRSERVDVATTERKKTNADNDDQNQELEKEEAIATEREKTNADKEEATTTEREKTDTEEKEATATEREKPIADKDEATAIEREKTDTEEKKATATEWEKTNAGNEEGSPEIEKTADVEKQLTAVDKVEEESGKEEEAERDKTEIADDQVNEESKQTEVAESEDN